MTSGGALKCSITNGGACVGSVQRVLDVDMFLSLWDMVRHAKLTLPRQVWFGTIDAVSTVVLESSINLFCGRDILLLVSKAASEAPQGYYSLEMCSLF